MALLNTTCPQCGTPHARKLSVIHAEGLSTVQTDINTVGTFNTIGRQKITTKGSSTGVQQTQASKDAAPPVVPEPLTLGMKFRLSAVVVGIIMCVAGFTNDSTTVATAGIFAILGSFVIPTKATAAELEVHEKKTRHLRAARDAWASTFQCTSCSHRFVPPDVQAA